MMRSLFPNEYDMHHETPCLPCRKRHCLASAIDTKT